MTWNGSACPFGHVVTSQLNGLYNHPPLFQLPSFCPIPSPLLLFFSSRSPITPPPPARPPRNGYTRSIHYFYLLTNIYLTGRFVYKILITACYN
jgi:hypothetical protein